MNGANADSREIIARLDRLVRLTALNSIGGKSLKDQVALLNSVGMTPAEMSEILGKNANLIRVTLHGIRKGEKR